jgi:hypothetical protein
MPEFCGRCRGQHPSGRVLRVTARLLLPSSERVHWSSRAYTPVHNPKLPLRRSRLRTLAYSDEFPWTLVNCVDVVISALPRSGSGVRIPSPAPIPDTSKAAGDRGFWHFWEDEKREFGKAVEGRGYLRVTSSVGLAGARGAHEAGRRHDDCDAGDASRRPFVRGGQRRGKAIGREPRALPEPKVRMSVTGITVIRLCQGELSSKTGVASRRRVGLADRSKPLRPQNQWLNRAESGHRGWGGRICGALQVNRSGTLAGLSCAVLPPTTARRARVGTGHPGAVTLFVLFPGQDGRIRASCWRPAAGRRRQNIRQDRLVAK